MPRHLWVILGTFTILFGLTLYFDADSQAASLHGAPHEFTLALNSTLPSPTCLEIPENECNALKTLFLSTNGTNWENHEGWLATVKPCQWYGVTCRTNADNTTYVYALNLNWNHLQGSIPVELAMLTRLQILSLSGNELSGSIPPALGMLTNLRTLNLAENQLVGELPPALGNLVNLTVLHLFENNFLGNLPVEFANLQALRNFKFQNTALCMPQDIAVEAWLDNIYYLSRPETADCQRVETSPRPLVLIYAVLDNNLSSEWSHLVNNAEKGVRDGAFDIQLLVDAQGENNSYAYTLQADNNDGCPSLVLNDFDCNRYRLRQTLRAQLENTAQRDTLAAFVTNAILAHPNASHIVLVLVGHGAGWGANALPAQPRGWSEQGEVVNDGAGGMLWDDTPTAGITQTQSLSTRALGSALAQVKSATGRSIDLLYLDACSMAMVEVAYELRESVAYLLASENTKWATFPYDELLPLVAGMTDGRALGTQWLDREVEVLQRSPGHPFTFSLIDLAQTPAIVTATTTLVDAITPLLATQPLTIRQAFSQTSHFDSDYNGTVNGEDAFVDLADFAHQLELLFANQPTVVDAARALQVAVAQAVVNKEFDDSLPDAIQPAPNLWGNLGGLSIYLPLATDEAKRSTLYNAENLAWADQSKWDEWLEAYWQAATQPPAPIAIGACDQTANCPSLSGWGFLPDTPTAALYYHFVPLVQR
jgi:Clostripain family/Leucine Rich repeats (2 copies)